MKNLTDEIQAIIDRLNRSDVPKDKNGKPLNTVYVALTPQILRALFSEQTHILVEKANTNPQQPGIDDN